MKKALDVGRADTPSNRSTQYFWLDDTLGSYEVEELDARDLARLLPQVHIEGEEREAAEAALT